MALLAPQISDIEVNASPVQPGVAITAESVANLGTSIKGLVDSLDAMQEQQQEMDTVVSPETGDTIYEPIPTPAMADSGLSIPAQSFLDAIASAEGTGGDYNIIVGGKKFEGTQHPDIVGLVTEAGPSTAAGKYQITKQTWDYLQGKYPELTDFSPQNQDKAAYLLAKERYKINTKGRDLDADLLAGNTTYLRSALQDTWRGIVIDRDFEGRIKRSTKARTPTIVKPVGFTNLRYSNQGAIRNRPVSTELENKLDLAVSSVLGVGYTVDIFSGGQEGERRTGSVRHNADAEGRGMAADVKIYDPTGKQVTDTKRLDALKEHWIKNNYGSVGTYMEDTGMHFDIWTQDKLLPGMTLTWSYE